MAENSTQANASYIITGFYNRSFTDVPMSMEFIHIVDFYVTPTMSFVGIITNLVTLAVVVRPPLNNFAPSVYVAAYCISSTLVLFLITGLGSILHINNWPDIEIRSESSCKLWSFVKSIVTSSPNWFLTGAAVDRVVAVWKPKRAQNMCSVFIAKILVCLIIVFLITITVHEMWSNSVIENYSRSVCQVDYRESFYKYLGFLMRPALLQYLPTFLLFVLGNLLVIRLCLKHHGRQIPNTASTDLDFTYVITVHSLTAFALNAPVHVIHILVFTRNTHTIDFLYQVFHYIQIATFLPIFFVMLVQCRDFREILISLIRTNPLCCSQRGSSIELRLMNEYNQVPSASTSV